MLQFFRSNAKGVLGKTIVGAIVIVFTLWGAQSIVAFSASNNSPVSVNGVDISEYEVSRMSDIQKRNIQTQLGDAYDPSLISDAMVRQSVIQTLINQQLEWQAAIDFGMAMSDEQVTEIIVNAPVFQVEGKFDKDTYTRLIGQYGYSPTDYINVVKQDLINSQLKNGLVSTGFILDQEVSLVASLDGQTRDISVLNINPENYLDEIELVEDDILAYYEDNKGQYRTEEQVSMNYVVLSRDKLAETLTVSSEELKQAYELFVAQESGNVEKSISHILITTDELSNKEAKILAEEIKDRAEQGESFAELAKTYSQDPGSSESGGDLGTFISGMFVPEFEDAVNNMSEAGLIAGPIKTDFGYHVITLTSLSEAEVPSFESQESRLMGRILNRKVEDELISLKEDLVNLAFSESNLTLISDQFDLAIETSESFDRSGGNGIFADTSVAVAAFDITVIEDNENSEVVSLSDGSLLVMHLNEYQSADYIPVNDVRDLITTALKQDSAGEMAISIADQLISDLSGSEVLEVSDESLEWVEYQNVERSSGDIDSSITSLAFKMPKPTTKLFSISQVQLTDGSISLVAVRAVQSLDDSDTPEDQEGIQNYLVSVVSQADFEQWFAGVLSTAKVKFSN